MAEVLSLLQIDGMEKLKSELSEWVLSQSITSSGFMTKPADLQQQLYAQREIAIRELAHNGKGEPTQRQPTPPPPEVTAAPSTASSTTSGDKDEFFDARSATPLEEPAHAFCLSYPLMNSCLVALDVTLNYFNVLPTLIFLNSMFRNLPEVSRTILSTKIPQKDDERIRIEFHSHS